LIGFAALGLSFILLCATFLSSGTGATTSAQSQVSMFEGVWNSILADPRNNLGTVFWQWLFASYRYTKVDDYLQGAWFGVALLALIMVIANERKRFFSFWRVQLMVCASVAAIMFYIIPEWVGPPLNWWGARLRLPPIVVLLLVPIIGTIRWKSVTNVAAGLGIVTVALGLVDLGIYHQKEMTGLSEVIEQMPKGQRISILHYTPREVNEYPGQPYGYAGNYYVLHKGGLVPQTITMRRELPLVRKFSLPAPPWGMAAGFRSAQHLASIDGFLVRRNEGPGHAPFLRSDLKQIEHVKSAQNWHYYRVKTSTAGKDKPQH
jgi:hypothetical protein